MICEVIFSIILQNIEDVLMTYGRIDDAMRCPKEPGCSRAEVLTSSNVSLKASPVCM